MCKGVGYVNLEKVLANMAVHHLDHAWLDRPDLDHSYSV